MLFSTAAGAVQIGIPARTRVFTKAQPGHAQGVREGIHWQRLRKVAGVDIYDQFGTEWRRKNIQTNCFRNQI